MLCLRFAVLKLNPHVIDLLNKGWNLLDGSSFCLSIKKASSKAGPFGAKHLHAKTVMKNYISSKTPFHSLQLV